MSNNAMTSIYYRLYKLYELLLIQSYTEENQLKNKVPIQEIKVNQISGVCVICSDAANLGSLYGNVGQHTENVNFSQLIMTCFHIKLFDDLHSAEICENCVSRLKEAALFRKHIEEVSIRIRKAQAALENIRIISKQKAKLKRSTLRHDEEIQINQDDFDEFDIFDSETLENDEYDEDGKIEDDAEPKRKEWFDQNHFPKQEKYTVPTLSNLTKTCPVCKENFDSKRKLKLHFEYHFPKYLCDICGKIFSKNVTYRAHLETHVDRFPCPQCSKTYAHKNSVLQHVESFHNQKKLYSCPKCKIRLSTSYKRREHLMKKHGVQFDRHICKVCTKNCFTAHGLELHFRKYHMKEKNESCPECGAMFFSKYNLSVHMMSHSDVRNFCCDHCGKAFKGRKTLMEHLKIHYNIRNHVCTVCGQAFVQRTSLKVHINAHH